MGGLLQALNLGVWGALYSLWFTQPFRILLKVDSSGPNLRLVIGNYWTGQLNPQKWDLETQMIVVSKCSILPSSMWIDYIISSVMGFPSTFGIKKGYVKREESDVNLGSLDSKLMTWTGFK